MTCVAAWICAATGRVHLAADTLAVDTNGTTMPVSKLVATPDGSVIGVAGQSQTVALVRRNPPLPPAGGEDLGDWAQDWAERITERQLERGIVEADDEHATYGVMLLARDDRLWEIGTYVANPVRRRYHAIGSGDAVAFGVLWALTRNDQAGPYVASLAVEAACDHMVDVGGRIDTAATSPA